MQNRPPFRRRHPILFFLTAVVTAMLLFGGGMAVFRSCAGQEGVELTERGIGVVMVQGVITDSRTITDYIARLRDEEKVAGVLVRIDSPGGVVGPSQEIYAAVRRLAEVKPVVASMGAAAASGGYYVACGAPVIVANPGTITASIGVIIQFANVEELFNKLGISEQSVTSGELKGAGTPFRSMTEKERAYFQALVDDLHDQFVQAVAESRTMDADAVRALADGRVMSGRQAQAAGLVDELGGYEEALERLKEECGLTGRVEIVEGPKKERSLLGRLLGEMSISLDFPNATWSVRYE